MFLLSMGLLLAWTLPGPTLIPTDDYFCPEHAVLQEEHFAGKAFYTCATAGGLVLWQTWWCGPVPQPAAQMTAALCVPDGVIWDDPWQGMPHFHCEARVLRWHLHCRMLNGQRLWEVPLE